MQGGQGCSRRLDLPGEELREENVLPTKKLAQSMVCEAPRPGKVSSAIADCHKVRFVLEEYQTNYNKLKGYMEKSFKLHVTNCFI